MAIEFRCSVCGKGFVVDEKYIGRKTLCKSCGATLRVPESGESMAIVVAAGDASPGVAASSANQPARKPVERDPQLLSEISRHVETHIGPIARIFRDLDSEQQQVDLFLVKPSDERPFHTLITCGMSEQPMNAPEDAKDRAYAELILCLPQAWPLDDASLRDDANYWPLRWMKFVARFPHDNNTFLTESFTVPNGSPPQPFHSKTSLVAWIFTPPLALPNAVGKMQRAKHAVHFLTMMPLHEDELQLRLSLGYKELMQHLTREFTSRELISLRRKSVCKLQEEPKAEPATQRLRYVGKGISTQCKCGAQETPPLRLAGTTIRCYQCGAPVYVPCSSKHTEGEPTEAPNPAGVPMNIAKFLIHQPSELVMPIAAITAIILAVIVYLFNASFDNTPETTELVEYAPMALVAAGGLFIAGSAWRIRKWRSQFKDGNLCPAVVISTSPPRLAVFTDMATGNGKAQKVIKVIPHTLIQIGGQDPQVGQKVATAASYHGKAKEERWEEFVPVPLQYATDQPAAIDHALAAIDSNDWRQLEQGLQKIPQSQELGYYWIQGQA